MTLHDAPLAERIRHNGKGGAMKLLAILLAAVWVVAIGLIWLFINATPVTAVTILPAMAAPLVGEPLAVIPTPTATLWPTITPLPTLTLPDETATPTLFILPTLAELPILPWTLEPPTPVDPTATPTLYGCHGHLQPMGDPAYCHGHP